MLCGLVQKHHSLTRLHSTLRLSATSDSKNGQEKEWPDVHTLVQIRLCKESKFESEVEQQWSSLQSHIASLYIYAVMEWKEVIWDKCMNRG